MPKIINTTSESLKARKIFNLQGLNFYAVEISFEYENAHFSMKSFILEA